MQSYTQILALNKFFEKFETIIIKIFYFEILLSIPNSKFYLKVYTILDFNFKEGRSL